MLHHCFSSTIDHSTENKSASTNFLTDDLNGEFCYVQTFGGKIVSIHYALTDNYKGINIKRSIASTFQANFDGNKENVEETDASSIHTSHYRCVCVYVLCMDMYMYMCVCTCVCVCIFVCACVCICVYVCISEVYPEFKVGSAQPAEVLTVLSG